MSEQNERIAQVKRHLRDGNHAAALPILDDLIRQRPDEAPLHWHRQACLEALDRPEEALAAVRRVLELKPDFAKAWLRRAELSSRLQEDYPAYESDLCEAITLDPQLGAAHRALALLYWGRDEEERARAALMQALAADPGDSEAYVIRASWAGSRAWSPSEGEETVRQFNGMEFSRAKLEQAVGDLRQALALAPEQHRLRLRLARHLHELGWFDEAVAECDLALAAMPKDDRLRGFVLEMRDRSKGGGAGERNQLAEILERSTDGSPDARLTAEDDLANSMMRHIAQRMRQGEGIEAAMEQFAAEDKDTLLAVNIADKLYQNGNNPKSNYRSAKPEEFARFQRRFAVRARRALEALGFRWVGDYEPVHLAPVLSEKTLLRCYLSADGSSCGASFSIRPAWPGWLAWAQMKMRGQYLSPEIIDVETSFDDGSFLVTNNGGGINPLGDGPLVDTEAMPLGTPARDIHARHVQRQQEYLRSHPGAGVIPMEDIEDLVAMQDRLAAAKNAHRRSIGYATDAELQKLLGDRQDLAPRVREQLALLRAPATLEEPVASQGFSRGYPGRAVMSLAELIEFALEQGMDEVRDVGSPLHPFYLDEKGSIYFLLDLQGQADPMEMALKSIRDRSPDIERCALVLDSRIAAEGGRKQDAIVVVACERDAAEGETWAQRYVPKGLLRKFRADGQAEQIGGAKNFIAVALEQPA